MKLTDTSVFMGHTFLKYDEPLLGKKIKSINVDGKYYNVIFPYDMPYTLMIAEEVDTVGKSIELVYYSDEEWKVVIESLKEEV